MSFILPLDFYPDDMASLLRSVLSILSGRVAGILISVVFTPILVRVVSQEQYGVYASLLAAFSILTLIAKGGLFDASRKIVADHAADARETSVTVSLSLLLAAAYGTVAIALTLASVRLGVVPTRYVPYVWILTGTIAFGNVLTIVRGAFYGMQDEHVGETLQIAQRLLYTVVGLGLAYLGYDLFGVFAGYTASFAVIGLVGLGLLSRTVDLVRPSLDRLRTRGRELAAYGGLQLVGGLSAAFLYRADVLLVEYFKSPTDTALYNSAIVPAELIWFVPSVIQLAFLQHTASLWADDDVEAINEDVRTGFKYGVLSLTLFGVGLFALADPFLRVYFGPEYVRAASTLQLLIVGTFFFGTSRIIAPVLQATGWIRQTQLVTVGALVLNVGLNLVLIPRYGIVGAGVGTAISYVAIFGGNLFFWIRSPFAVAPPRWVGRLLLVQAAFAVPFLGIVAVSDFRPLVSLAVLPIVGFALFVVVNGAAGYVPVSTVVSRLTAISDRVAGSVDED